MQDIIDQHTARLNAIGAAGNVPTAALLEPSPDRQAFSRPSA
jgi:hypothetical protein